MVISDPFGSPKNKNANQPENGRTKWHTCVPLLSPTPKVCMDTQDLNGFDSNILALCPTEFQFPPKPRRHVFWHRRHHLGCKGMCLRLANLQVSPVPEYGTSPGHGRNILRILKTCQSLGSLKATSKGNHDGFPTSPRKAMLGLNPVISGHFQSVWVYSNHQKDRKVVYHYILVGDWTFPTYFGGTISCQQLTTWSGSLIFWAIAAIAILGASQLPSWY